MKLSQYAKRHEIGYRAAWNRYKSGKIEGAYLDDGGHVIVPEPHHAEYAHAAVYARVSTPGQKHDLERQSDRLIEYAIASGLTVDYVVKEIASGVNDTRPKLTKLLNQDGWGTLVVEHRDRLTRVGFTWFQVLLEKQGKRIIVVNAATEKTDDLMSDLMSIMYSFTARMYGLRSAKRRTSDAMKALAHD